MTMLSSIRGKQQHTHEVQGMLLTEDLPELSWTVTPEYPEVLSGYRRGDDVEALRTDLAKWAAYFGVELQEVTHWSGPKSEWSSHVGFDVRATVDEVRVRIWALVYLNEADRPAPDAPAEQPVAEVA